VSNDLESALLIVVLLALTIGLPFIPAFIARRKGYAFWQFYLFALLCWFPAAIVIMVLTDRNNGERFGFGTR
jgi:hypothetical protein